MLLALTDHLRCTASHEESALVARADVAEHRRMARGVLGCPVCLVEREVQGGVIYWGAAGAGAALLAPLAPPAQLGDADEDAVLRAGALLGFADSLAPFVLCGTEAAAAIGLSGMADAALVLLDPPDDRAAPLATLIRGAPRVPMAAASARGVALDARGADPLWMASAVRALAPRGRLVAPVACAVPPGIRELARDEVQWVGEREPDFVSIGRGVLRSPVHAPVRS